MQGYQIVKGILVSLVGIGLTVALGIELIGLWPALAINAVLLLSFAVLIPRQVRRARHEQVARRAPRPRSGHPPPRP